MKTENPTALHFIMQDDIFLLNQDRAAYTFEAEPAEQAIEQEEAQPVTPVQTKQPEFNYLGGNKKNFLITVHYPGIDFMEESHLTALQNTLKRLGFEKEDIAILNLAAHEGADHEMIISYFKPQKLLLMGKNALPPYIPALKLNEQQINGNYKALFTFSFDEMMDSNDYKKIFWEQMKIL
ncbi:hypothetical protein [Mucilaginibacter sp.]